MKKLTAKHYSQAEQLIQGYMVEAALVKDNETLTSSLDLIADNQPVEVVTALAHTLGMQVATSIAFVNDLVLEKAYAEDAWWNSLNDDQKKGYLDQHPNSKYAAGHPPAQQEQPGQPPATAQQPAPVQPTAPTPPTQQVQPTPGTPATPQVQQTPQQETPAIQPPQPVAPPAPVAPAQPAPVEQPEQPQPPVQPTQQPPVQQQAPVAPAAHQPPATQPAPEQPPAPSAPQQPAPAAPAAPATTPQPAQPPVAQQPAEPALPPQPPAPPVGPPPLSQRLQEKIMNAPTSVREFFTRGGQQPGSPERRQAGQMLRDKSKGLAKHFIHQHSHALHGVHALAKLAKSRSWGSMSTHDKDAIKTLCVEAATTAAGIALTGGLSHLVHAPAMVALQHVAGHWYMEAAAKSVYHAVMKANVVEAESSNSEENMLSALFSAFADLLETAQIPDDVWEQTADSMNSSGNGYLQPPPKDGVKEDTTPGVKKEVDTTPGEKPAEDGEEPSEDEPPDDAPNEEVPEEPGLEDSTDEDDGEDAIEEDQGVPEMNDDAEPQQPEEPAPEKTDEPEEEIPEEKSEKPAPFKKKAEKDDEPEQASVDELETHLIPGSAFKANKLLPGPGYSKVRGWIVIISVFPEHVDYVTVDRMGRKLTPGVTHARKEVFLKFFKANDFDFDPGYDTEDITASLEVARIKGSEEYTWLQYTGKPLILDWRGHKVTLNKGDEFGVRMSSNKKDKRIILDRPDFGLTKVMTLTPELEKKLSVNCDKA